MSESLIESEVKLDLLITFSRFSSFSVSFDVRFVGFSRFSSVSHPVSVVVRFELSSLSITDYFTRRP